MSEWIKSSFSGDQGACVEVRIGHTVDVRDTKDRSRAPFTVSPSAWTAFVEGVKRRDFD
jgi:hypothetical protein